MQTLSALSARMSISAVLLLVPGALGAQTYVWSPPNTGTGPGNGGNTIPFWSTSATYQQVHEASILLGPVMVIKGLAMRPSGNGMVTGRSWDMQIALSHTKIDASNASTTFANNMGTPSTIVFGTASSYTTFSWKSFTGSGTTPAFTIPFTTPFTYLAPLGNLAWEWRHKNATSNAFMAMDVADSVNDKGSALPSIGTGCTATGQTSTAAATMTPVRTNPPNYQHHLEVLLANGTSSAGAVLAVGLSQATVNIGWCAPIINTPLLLPGMTDPSGSWVFRAPLGVLAGIPPTAIYTQFGFADAALPGGIGLTDVAGYKSPKIPGANGLARIFRSISQGTSNGDELATSGNADRGYGLSVGWLQ